MGGTTGLVYMMLPVVAFVLANSSYGLTAAVCTAVGVALAISVLRLVRKESVQPALSGLFGVAVASFVAWKTGSAKGFFLTGIWANLALAVLFLVSVLVRRPLAGVVWGALNGTGTAWLKDKPSRHYYDIATLTLVGVFAARVAVQQWLYDQDRTGWLAVAKIAMGYPLLALAFLVVLWAGRRSGKRLKALAGQRPTGSS
ncbi:integral membrane alanine and leucine rich protein [Streptomyces malaysiensis subsp. malaysiensis]|nr:integral membrane alanine and leucine rich protein [Streptomyces malaysiensis]